MHRVTLEFTDDTWQLLKEITLELGLKSPEVLLNHFIGSALMDFTEFSTPAVMINRDVLASLIEDIEKMKEVANVRGNTLDEYLFAIADSFRTGIMSAKEVSRELDELRRDGKFEWTDSINLDEE